MSRVSPARVLGADHFSLGLSTLALVTAANVHSYTVLEFICAQPNSPDNRLQARSHMTVRHRDPSSTVSMTTGSKPS